MAILRSLDGRFFEIPDSQVEQFLIPEDKVKEKLEGAGAPMVPPGGEGQQAGPPPGTPTIVVQIFGASPAAGGPAGPPPIPTGGEQAGSTPEVQPYGWWNNWWHNRRGGWNNWWHNWHP
jgi:hypothetical protein